MIARLNKTTMAFFAAILLYSLVCQTSVSASTPDFTNSILDVLNRQEVVKITITADFDSLIGHRNTEEYLEGGFSFQDEEGVRHSYGVKVKPRGKFRRRTCDFPPLKLKFSKKELEKNGLSHMNELKLVTHCLDDKAQGNSLLMREYLVYKMYNELTPMSFRVQLAKITYVDSSGKGKKMTRWGFLIEDVEELEFRKGGQVCDCMGQQKDAMQPTHERMASVFQFMIGNSDWSVEMNRNLKLLRIGDEKLIPVPYDFDFSAVVGAPYARPNTNLGQLSVSQRIFMGYAGSAEEVYSTISYFKSKKPTLYQLILKFKYLDEDTRVEMINYLDEFYQLVEDPLKLEESMFPRKAVIEEVGGIR